MATLDLQLDQDDPHAPVTTDWRFRQGVHARKMDVVRGTVEYNRDPDRRGRVMVRVLEDGPEFQIRNEKEPRVSTFDLGWCSPLFGHAGGMGFGSFNVPPVGARVFVLYERGNEQNPVYFGGWYANAPKQRRYGATKTTVEPPKKEFEDDPGFSEAGDTGGDYKYPPKPTPYQGYWEEEQGPEIPLELTEMIDHTPDTQMFFKTLKGAALMVKERDEAEELFLVDRLGAELRFESNTTLMENGVERRGRVSATQHEGMELDNLAYGRHTLSLLSASRSGLELENNTWGEDFLSLQIHPEDGRRNRELSQSRVVLDLDEAESRMRLLYMEGGTERGHITFDLISRRIDIQGLDRIHLKSDKDVILETGKVVVRGDLEVQGEIFHTNGDKLTFFDNDTSPYGTPTRNYWPADEPIVPYDDNVDWGRHKQDGWEYS